jgi:hypothetical protein
MSKTTTAMFVVAAVACATPALADGSGYGFGAPEPGPGDGLRDRVDQLLGCAAFLPAAREVQCAADLDAAVTACMQAMYSPGRGDLTQAEWDECFGDLPYMCGDEPTPGCLQVADARFDGWRESTGPNRGVHHERTAPSRRDQDRRPGPRSETGELQVAGGGQGSNHEGTNSDTGGGSFGRDVAAGTGAIAGNRVCGAACGVAAGAATGYAYDRMQGGDGRGCCQGDRGAYNDTDREKSQNERSGDGSTGTDQGY